METKTKEERKKLIEHVEHGRIRQVENWISTGGDLSLLNAFFGIGGMDGRGALSLAIKNKNINMVKLLVENKVDINEKCEHNAMPLTMAVGNNDVEMAKSLVELGANWNTLLYTLKGQKDNMAKITVNRDVKLPLGKWAKDVRFTTPINWGEVKEIKLVTINFDNGGWYKVLLNYVGCDGCSMCESNDKKTRDQFVEKTLLTKLAEIGQVEIIKHLIEQGVKTSESETESCGYNFHFNLIKEAISFGKKDIIKDLLGVGVKLDIKTEYGEKILKEIMADGELR